MGSRIRSNCEHIFEFFCEIALPNSQSESAFILQKYPESYSSQEILKCVPQFAYPCVYYVDIVTHFSFVLTNIDSKWTFGFCRHAPKSETCIVILSCLPWHSTFFRILNQCAELTNQRATYLTRFLDSIYNCDVPQPGLQLSVTYCTDDKVFEFNASCPDHHKLPSIPEDRNLTEYFNAIDATNMIVIFANMLNERRIIMTSKKLSRLSACVQAANSLIYPMHWQHIFIPVLPHHLLDYLSAPMPFLIGVPSVIMNRVKRSELGDIVILDADENKIESPFDDVHMLPNDIIHSLKKSLRNPMAMLGDGVARSFLRALVILIGGYRDALRLAQGEKITFNYEAFVATRPPSIQTFLEKMLQLQIFRQFIEGRLEMLNDGEGFSDEFEFELNMYEDKSTHRLKTQYKEWLGTMRKEGGAILKSVNPAMKSAYKQVKDKGKQAYKDLRSKIQTNNTNNNYSSNNTHKTSSANYTSHKPSSVPSSPTLPIRGRSIKKSMSGNVIGKTDKTVTYVRENSSKLLADKNRTDKNVNKLYNGFDSSSSNGLSVSSHSSSSSSGNRLAPEASPEVSDVDSDHSHEMLTFNRIDMDLMGELKDFLHKRSSIDESSNSTKSSNSQSSSASNNALSFITKPIPPPRSQLTRKLKPITDENSKEVPLIELDTPPEEEVVDNNSIIFDPLFEKKSDSKQRPLPLPISNNSNNNNNWCLSVNSKDFNTLTPNSSSNSLSGSLNPVNPFVMETQQNSQTKNNLYFGQPYNAQTSALSMTNTNQTTTDSFNDMINWSSSQITSGSQNVNLMGRALPIPTPSHANSNPFKTTNSWQHFD